MAARAAVVAALGLWLLAGVAGRAEVIDRILAVVAGQVITLSDVRAASELGLVDAAGAPDVVGAVLERLIERELILAEVQRYQPPEPDRTALEDRLDIVRQRAGGADGLRATLAAVGLSEARLRTLIRDDLRIDLYLEQRFVAAAQPTEEDVKRYYLEHAVEFARDGAVPPLEQVRETIRRRLATERRRRLIADWVADLRRRGDVTSLYLPRT